MTVKIDGHLTLIITTSVSPSVPSPELISDLLVSLPPELRDLPLVITFDKCRTTEGLPKRPTGKGPRLKLGQASDDLVELYPQYVENVRALFAAESPGTWQPDSKGLCTVSYTQNGRVTLLCQSQHTGFAFGVKSCLDHCKTSHVFVLQHDWHFRTPAHGKPQLPFRELLDAMSELRDSQGRACIEYLTFVARHTTDYESSRGNINARSRFVMREARKRLKALPRDKRFPHIDHVVPCLHIFDRPHIASRDFYTRLFALQVADVDYEDTRLTNQQAGSTVGKTWPTIVLDDDDAGSSGLHHIRPMLRKGDFIEDRVGTVVNERITRSSTDEYAYQAWDRWRCWIFCPRPDETMFSDGDGKEMIPIKHVSGRTKLVKALQQAKIEGFIEKNTLAAASGRSKHQCDDRDENDEEYDTGLLDLAV
ncbi:hypothetical protein PYCC9005_002400 [Savitreella phatthalungensis]